MADITSTTYTVVSESKSGDQFVMVRGGQVKKLTRQGLVDLIAEEAPDTILELTDTPTSYLSQQGKVLAVNATETGMEFVSSDLAPSFITAPDTPVSYSGEANKWPVVNGAENALVFQSPVFTYLSDTPANYTGAANKYVAVNGTQTGLEFVDSDFIDHTDTPANYTGSSEYIVRVNTAADGLEFVPEKDVQTTGWAQYADTQYTSGSPFGILANTDTILPNNALSVIDIQKPADITTFYDGSVITGREGESILITIDFVANPTAAGTTYLEVWFDIGGAVGELYRRIISFPKGVGVVRPVSFTVSAYTLNTWEANGATVYVRANGTADLYDIRYVITRVHKAI